MLRAPLYIAAALLCGLTDPASACRCAPQPLARYFADAELVFLGRAESVRTIDGAPGHRTVGFAVQGKPYKGDPAALESFATPLSSASCGYAVERGRLYLVFASRHAPGERIAWFDTCNGTRDFDPKAPGGVQGFVDTPPADVLPQLAALRAGGAGDPRTTATPRLPRPGDPAAQVVGLLELPGVLGAAGEPAAAPRPLQVYAEPRADLREVWSVRAPAEVLTREYGYEQPGAVVRERRDGWFRIALADGRDGWVRAQDVGTFHALPALLVGRLTYLDAHWDGWIWPDPGAGHPQPAARRSEQREQPVNVVATADIGGSLWLQVEVLDADPCAGQTPKVTHGGWVPAYTPDGQPVAWFHSRGC